MAATEELSPAVDASTGEAEPLIKPKALEGEFWYVGAVSERKAEKILSQQGLAGGFLIRDSLLPDADYVLSINSGEEIWHYDIKFLNKDECIFNKYTFPSIYEIIEFYSENRLGKVYLEPPEEPLVSEIVTKSTASKIKLAPKSMKQTQPRFSPITKRALPASGTNNVEPASKSTSSLTDTVTATSDAYSEKNEQIMTLGQPDKEQTPDQSRILSDGATEKDAVETAPPPSTEIVIKSNPLSAQDENNFQSNTKVAGREEKSAASPATIIRHNSRAAILSELKRLPSIKKARVLVSRRIQGSDSDEDTDSDDDVNDEQSSEEEKKKPPPPPLPVRTTPPLKSSPVHSQQETAGPLNNNALANNSSPAITPSASPSPPLLKPEESVTPLITLSEDENSPTDDVILFAPSASHPEPSSESAMSVGNEDSLPNIGSSNDSPPTLSTSPATIPPSARSKPYSPTPSPRRSPEMQKRQPRPIPLESDATPDQEDEDMPPPPPMSTHPEVIKARTLPRKFHTEEPVDLSATRPTTTQEAEDMPPPLPISTHPEVMKASTLPRKFHAHEPQSQPTSLPLKKPSPRPRNMLKSRGRISSEPNTSAVLTEESTQPLPPPDSQNIEPPVSSSQVAIAEAPEDTYLLAASSHEPRVRHPHSLQEDTATISPPVTTNAEKIISQEGSTIPLQETEAASTKIDDTTPPHDVSDNSGAITQPSQLQQPATEGSAGATPGENLAAQSAAPGHSFFFTTTSAAGNKPISPAAEGGGEWSGPLTVSGPTNVESLMKCGPMNSRRTGPPVKKKRSILRRKK